MSKPVLAWHFVGGALRDGRPIPPDGEWLRHDGDCIMCSEGLHASRRLIDALQYAPGPTICRVAVSKIAAEDRNDKLVAAARVILWRLPDADAVLRAFARKCALSVIHLWGAPDVVRRYLETGDETLRAAAWDAARAAAWDAARDAAWAAARAAARDAAWAAARDAARAAARAAARDAAWAAAWAAARDAAWDAARDAARDAAWAAARDAAWAAARDAAISKFNADLEAMVIAAAGSPDDKALIKKAGKP